ncbi:MAG: single-stranded DNA-binding protein [Actinomycetota bacterium]
MNEQNYVSLTGRLTADPDARQTPAGVAVTEFAIAVNRRVRNGEGRFEDRLDGYFDCQTWRDEAEISAKVLRKGTAVRVIGILLQKRWQDGEGNPRSRIVVQADEVYVPLGIANLAET